MLTSKKFTVLIALISLLLMAAQCGSPSQPTGAEETTAQSITAIPLAAGERLNVVATTSIVADMVQQVGGEHINLHLLIPLGNDPHSFTPTPQDMTAVSDAHVIFENGYGFEGFMTDLIASVGRGQAVVSLSRGVEAHVFGEDAAEHAAHEETHHTDAEIDPHTWMSAANALIFVDNIAQTLSQLDPPHAESYQAKAAAYQAELTALDTWIFQQIETIPPDKRQLVTDHDSFGYYTDRYGLELVGAVIPAYSTNASPSAQELAALQDAIAAHGVQAVFVGQTANTTLAQRLAEDTGIRIVSLYTGSLGAAGSEADSYINYMRYNTQAIVEALGK